MSVNIREIAGRQDLKQFVSYPFQLYRDSSCWVPPLIGSELKNLDPATNPAFEFLRGRYWLAENEDGRVCGRIAGFLPATREHESDNAASARFGYFDFDDDSAISRALFEEAARWARSEGYDSLNGPSGVTTFDTSAVLVEGFDELPTASSSYNHPYYASHLEALGLSKDVDYLEYQISGLEELNARVAKLAAFTMKKKKVRLLEPQSRKDVRRRAPEAFALINEAYAGLHNFRPLTEKQIAFYTDMYFAFLDPAFVKFLYHGEDELVGVGIAMPSLSRGLQAARGRLLPFGWLHLARAMKRANTLDLYLVAVRRDWQKAGLPAILMHESHKSALARGMTTAETNGNLEDNDAVQTLWKLYNARQHKRRRLYRKSLATI